MPPAIERPKKSPSLKCAPQVFRITGSISDEITISRIKELVAKLETQKAELHPEQQK
jgi:hypothetical protein